jgi:isopenicillin N synthase-like dioxygenase
VQPASSFVSSDSARLPVIDLSLIGSAAPWTGHLAAQLDWAAMEFGFFYVVGHGVDLPVVSAMHEAAKRFFALPHDAKTALTMSRGGRAWRGYFPVGGELTSGQPDFKEGLYLGAELDGDDPRVRAGLPLHGRNLFPDIPGFREITLQYLDELTALSQRLIAVLGKGLGVGDEYFRRHYTDDPTVLFRLFNYPPAPACSGNIRGVGEHTDYGFLTLLYQDDAGGLQVKYSDQWIDVPYLPDSFVVNIGDMLERLTAGRYVSALHRVINQSGRARISMPFFFDPRFEAVLEPIPGAGPDRERQGLAARWDGIDLRQLRGTYGEYLLGKVARVFPELGRAQLAGFDSDISV